MERSSPILSGSNKVIGYFSHSHDREAVFCDGDACVIAATAKHLRYYLKVLTSDRAPEEVTNIIKKTRFGEIFSGLLQGGAYAFDAVSYRLFYEGMRKNRLNNPLPDYQDFLVTETISTKLLRIQWVL